MDTDAEFFAFIVVARARHKNKEPLWSQHASMPDLRGSYFCVAFRDYMLTITSFSSARMLAAKKLPATSVPFTIKLLTPHSLPFGFFTTM